MKIAVLLGGITGERKVSIASGAQVTSALRALGHNVWCFDTAFGLLSSGDEARLFKTLAGQEPPNNSELPKRDLTTHLLNENVEINQVDVVFNALHGGAGEDGTIQALLEAHELCYTGSAPLPTAAAMDKDVAKKLFRYSGVLTPDWYMAGEDYREQASRIGYPLIVKPNHGGSTLGVSLVRTPSALDSAIDLALQFDREIMLEQYIDGREFVIGVLGNRALGIGAITLTEAELFDYRSKYHPGASIETFPAIIDQSLETRIKYLAVKAHHSLKLGSYSRSDFRVDGNGDIWCLEVNVLPGLTNTSLMPQSATAAGISFPELCQEICDLAMQSNESAVEVRQAQYPNS
jgi:D-alanine-D-alanine ligase